MNVYLLRHADCHKAISDDNDMKRALTDVGRNTLTNMIPGLKHHIGQIDYIFTSPADRAIESANILAEGFRCKGFVEVMPDLYDEHKEEAINRNVNKVIGKENIVIVGHIPHLHYLAEYYLGEASPRVELGKAGMAKIYIKGFPEKGGGRLEWVKTAQELTDEKG